MISSILNGKNTPIAEEISVLTNPLSFPDNYQSIFMPKIKIDQTNKNTKIKSFAHEFLFVEDGEEGFVKQPTISMRVPAVRKTTCETLKESSKSTNFEDLDHLVLGKRDSSSVVSKNDDYIQHKKIRLH